MSNRFALALLGGRRRGGRLATTRILVLAVRSTVMVMSAVAHATTASATGDEGESPHAEQEPEPIACKPVHGNLPLRGRAASVVASRRQRSADLIARWHGRHRSVAAPLAHMIWIKRTPR